jgi:hypothetical protein
MVDSLANWNSQRMACAADGGYLVIPANTTELGAIATLTANPVWLGISDQATEGVWITVLAQQITFLPWQAGEPDNDSNSDCVAANFPTQQYSDQRCNEMRRAICECIP